MNNQVIQIKSTSIMTQWKSLGKNVKEDEQQQKKMVLQTPSSSMDCPDVLRASDETGKQTI